MSWDLEVKTRHFHLNAAAVSPMEVFRAFFGKNFIFMRWREITLWRMMQRRERKCQKEEKIAKSAKSCNRARTCVSTGIRVRVRQADRIEEGLTADNHAIPFPLYRSQHRLHWKQCKFASSSDRKFDWFDRPIYQTHKNTHTEGHEHRVSWQTRSFLLLHCKAEHTDIHKLWQAQLLLWMQLIAFCYIFSLVVKSEKKIEISFHFMRKDQFNQHQQKSLADRKCLIKFAESVIVRTSPPQVECKERDISWSLFTLRSLICFLTDVPFFPLYFSVRSSKGTDSRIISDCVYVSLYVCQRVCVCTCNWWTKRAWNIDTWDQIPIFLLVWSTVSLAATTKTLARLLVPHTAWSRRGSSSSERIMSSRLLSPHVAIVHCRPLIRQQQQQSMASTVVSLRSRMNLIHCSTRKCELMSFAKYAWRQEKADENKRVTAASGSKSNSIIASFCSLSLQPNQSFALSSAILNHPSSDELDLVCVYVCVH